MSAIDELDRKILRVLQQDASQPLEQIARLVGSSKSPVWTRIKKLKDAGVIKREIAVLDADKLGLHETFFIAVKTDRHSEQWLADFKEAIDTIPEILEAHRMAGEVDYLLKVRLSSTKAYDELYKKLIAKVELYNVTSMLVMENMKETTALKV